MSDTKKLIDELKEYSKDLEKIDRHLSGSFMDHGIMTTIRMETIDVVGRACISLAKLERELAAANERAEKAEAKLAELATHNEKLDDTEHQHIVELRLRAEAAERRAEENAMDAERYRTKRNIDAGKYVKSPDYMRHPPKERDYLVKAWEESYDAAIDAARSEEGKA